MDSLERWSVKPNIHRGNVPSTGNPKQSTIRKRA